MSSIRTPRKQSMPSSRKKKDPVSRELFSKVYDAASNISLEETRRLCMELYTTSADSFDNLLSDLRNPDKLDVNKLMTDVFPIILGLQKMAVGGVTKKELLLTCLRLLNNGANQTEFEKRLTELSALIDTLVEIGKTAKPLIAEGSKILAKLCLCGKKK